MRIDAVMNPEGFIKDLDLELQEKAHRIAAEETIMHLFSSHASVTEKRPCLLSTPGTG